MNINHNFFFSSRRRHTRCSRDWSSDVCSSDLAHFTEIILEQPYHLPTRRTLGKIKDHLTDIYRVFVRNGTLQLRLNNERSEERRVGKECRSRSSEHH